MSDTEKTGAAPAIDDKKPSTAEVDITKYKVSILLIAQKKQLIFFVIDRGRDRQQRSEEAH